MAVSRYSVVDLFSGAGGMSYGFHAHPLFKIVGAVDAQKGKPSSGDGRLECNKTYAANMGVEPLHADISKLSVEELFEYLRAGGYAGDVDILISCAPCTGFSRTIRRNLVEDDPRNNLVSRSADFVEELRPQIFLMENVGELLEGKFSYHFTRLKERLEKIGYRVHGEVHNLNEYGLPQSRRRALVLGVKRPNALHSLEDLWYGHAVRQEATTVRRAIGDLPRIHAGETHPSDKWHVSPNFTAKGLRRLSLIKKDGGSWPDLLKHPDGPDYLIPSMQRYVAQGRVGPHPDVYGRMAWDSPSITLKRECSHTGNGRYAHPDQDRLCTVREMAIIQGFPHDYVFDADSLSNVYRHIGDAVPPLISYQLAKVCEWILTGKKPDIHGVLLPRTHLVPDDIIEKAEAPDQLEFASFG